MDVGQIEAKILRRPHSPLFARLADEYLKSGRLGAAKELCLSGLQKYPAYTTARIILARCFFAENNYASTLEEVQNALKIYPDSSALWELVNQCRQAIMPSPLRELDVPITSDSVIQDPTKDITVDSDDLISDESIPLPLEEPVGEIIRDTLPVQLEHEESSMEQGIADLTAIIEESQRGATNQENEFSMVSGEPNETSPHGFSDEINKTSSTDMTVSDTDEVSSELIERGAKEINDNPAKSSEDVAEVIHADGISDSPVGEGNELTTQRIGEVIEGRTDGRIVSRTLAEIYVKQGALEEALITYNLLKERRPEQAEEFGVKIKELQRKIQARKENTQ